MSDSILGLNVTGHLGRTDSDFAGLVVEEYRVASGPMTGSKMVKVLLADGSHRYTFRGYVIVDIPNGRTLVGLGESQWSSLIFELTGDVEWPSTVVDDGFVTRDSGTLMPLIEEAHGWTQDCGRSYDTDKGALSYVEAVYDGGLYGFALACGEL